MTRKILILVANSKKTSQDEFGKQVREIEEALELAKYRDQFELVQRWAVRPRDIQRALLEVEPQIVHFLGRGAGFHELGNQSKRKLVPSQEDQTESEGLVLEDGTGQAKLVSGEALAALCSLFADKLECVVLNGCYLEKQAEQIAQCIPYVIATKEAISDKAAFEFAVGFYDALGTGHPVPSAFQFGCTAIQMAGSSEHLISVLHRKNSKNFPLPPITSEAERLEDHYKSIIDAIIRGRIIPFLGSNINLCDRIQANGEIEPSWKPDSSFPPSGKELAKHFAQTFPPQLEKIISNKQDTNTSELQEKVPLINKLIHEHAILISVDSSDKGSLHIGGEALQYLSQYAYLTNEGEFYDQLQQVQLGRQPNSLHNFFATLPAIMREKGYYPPYPLIVTTNYDCALERAFEKAKEPFDLVFYSNNLDPDKPDRFVHQKPDGTSQEIHNPSEYTGLSFKERTVILKLYGSVDQIREREGENIVITEEHYIEYLVTRNLSNLLPATILRKLRTQKPNILFLGYPLGDWNQRIILHRIWHKLTSKKRFKWWSIQLNTDPLAQQLWKSYDVILHDLPLKDYITELEQRVQNIPAKGDKGYE